MSKQAVLIVTAKAEGFRRAGRAWSKTPTTVDADAFTEVQVAALRADPMLSVTDGQVDVAKDPEAEAKAEAERAAAEAEAERAAAEAEAKAEAERAAAKAKAKAAKNAGEKAGK